MGFGPMGFGVAGVMGAKFAAPDRPCVSVCGDGAFFMHANVLGTAVEYNLRLWSGWFGTNPTPTPPSAGCSAVISVAANSPPTSITRRPARATIRISKPRWPGPAASKACASIAAGDLGEAIRKGSIAANKPYLIDVDIAADINLFRRRAFGSFRALDEASRESEYSSSQPEFPFAKIKNNWMPADENLQQIVGDLDVEAFDPGRPVSAHHMSFVGHSDMAGKADGVQVMVHRGHAFVGHSFNEGITVLDVENPKRPKVVNFIGCAPNTRSLHLQIHDDIMIVVNGIPSVWSMEQFQDPKNYFSGSLKLRN